MYNSYRTSEQEHEIQEQDVGEESKEQQLQTPSEKKVLRILWNRVLESPQHKPSNVFGRKALQIMFPCIRKELQQKQEQKPAAGAAPNETTAAAFVKEFETLLYFQQQAQVNEEDDRVNNDSALIWSVDAGRAELEKRMEQRKKE